MFKTKETVKPSGKGRTNGWGEIYGTITRVLEKSVIVQWHDTAVEDEMLFDELISTGEFASKVPRNYREIGDKIENGSTVDKLLNVKDD